jgi:hypothetical protein
MKERVEQLGLDPETAPETPQRAKARKVRKVREVRECQPKEFPQEMMWTIEREMRALRMVAADTVRFRGGK